MMKFDEAQKLALGLEIIAGMKASAYNVPIDIGREMTAEGTLPEHYEGIEVAKAETLAATELLKLNAQAMYIAGVTMAKISETENEKPKGFNCVFIYISEIRHRINLNFELDWVLKKGIQEVQGVELVYAEGRYSLSYEIGSAFDPKTVNANLERIARAHFDAITADPSLIDKKTDKQISHEFERMSEKRLQEVADILAPKKTIINYRALFIYAVSFVVAVIVNTLITLMAGGTWIPTTPLMYIARVLCIILLTGIIAYKIANPPKRNYRKVH